MSDRRKGLLYIVVAALLWSTGGIGIKALPDPALKVAFYRSVFAAVTLFALFRRDVRIQPSPAFFVSIVSYAGCLTTFVVATRWTTSANAIFLQYAGVVWVLLLAPVVLREPMRRRDIIAIVAALAGMALFFVGRFEARGMAGNAMALLSSVFFASMILALRRAHDASRAAVAWGNVALALALLPFVAHDLALTTKSLLALLFLGVFQIGVAYAFFVKGLRHVAATEASLTGMLEPVMNPIWVLLFIGERPSIYALFGGAIVLAAIAWHTLQGGEPASELPAPD
ncbi:MAG: DMT family transporter [Acidobacteria bacterium]|nr:DMT family transporter [Acidobacteriota bacterium]MBV9475573.1 DMT family transporter [Acidobacteriota bacterium]